MSSLFTESAVCRSRGHCATCQSPTEPARGFRLSQVARGFTDLPANGDVMPCPFGENPPTDGNLDPDEQELMAAAANPEGWGDHVAALIHKVGADRVYQLVRTGVGLPENCGGCNERRKALNRLEGWVKGVFTSSEHS